MKTDPKFKLKDNDWLNFKAHAEALTIPAASLPTMFNGAVWHFEPREFIKQFRMCGWLSLEELALTFPKHLFYTESGNPRNAITTSGVTYTLTHAQAVSRISNHQVDLNKVMRKYLGENKQRIAIFLAQVMLESAQWRNIGGSRRQLHEWFFGRYSQYNPATQYYTAFYGRGIMQLTWAGNYKLYGDYRKLPDHVGAYVERLTPASPRITAISTHYLAHPNNGGTAIKWYPRYDSDIVGEKACEACDSGGFYWISKSTSAGLNLNRFADKPYSVTHVGKISRFVNGGVNGYYDRQAYTVYLMRYLGDTTENTMTTRINLPSLKADIIVNFSGLN